MTVRQTSQGIKSCATTLVVGFGSLLFGVAGASVAAGHLRGWW